LKTTLFDLKRRTPMKNGIIALVVLAFLLTGCGVRAAFSTQPENVTRAAALINPSW
jgi:hypothetical protein